MAEPLRTAFGFSTTADEVVAGINLSGMRAVVTGASSGIGVETACVLVGAGAGAGAEVVLAVRRGGAGDEIAGQITEQTGKLPGECQSA